MPSNREFDKVWDFQTPATYVDETNDAADVVTNFNGPQAVGDILYIGDGTEFTRAHIRLSTVATGSYDVVIEYWDGDSWEAIPGVSDGTSDMTQNGTISFSAPGDWAQCDVNGTTLFWIRLRCIDAGTIKPICLSCFRHKMVAGATPEILGAYDDYNRMQGLISENTDFSTAGEIRIIRSSLVKVRYLFDTPTANKIRVYFEATTVDYDFTVSPITKVVT